MHFTHMFFGVSTNLRIHASINSLVTYKLKDLGIFKPGVHSLRPFVPGFLKLLWFVHRYVCVCLCPPPRALIICSVVWCDIGRMRLVKQVSWLFPAFIYFIWHLLLIKWIGVAILTQHVVNACQRKLKWCGTHYKRTTRKTEHFIHKSKWANV